MGHVRLDTRGEVNRLVFYVGNGRKVVPRRIVEVADVQAETLGPVVERVLAEFRGVAEQ